MPKPDLDNAYSLNSADDTKRLYADWAETYDQSFADAMDYVVPERVAEVFCHHGGMGPVLDFGTGTGLVGKHLAVRGVGPVDGVDLSPEMLAVAARKSVYRDLIARNMLDGLVLPAGTYSGVICSGTFTHGHVGPEAIDALLRVAASDALFALSINNAHFHAAGFADKFAELSDQIKDLTLPEIRLNNTPPKCLRWKTPAKVFREKMVEKMR